MKFFISLFAISLFASPALFAKSSVWKVSKGDQVIYIGGTVHMLRAQDYPLPAEFDFAYSKAEKLVFEVNPSELQDPAIAMKLMQSGSYMDGRTLQSVLSEEAYQSFAAEAQKYGLPAEMLDGFKPGMAIMMVTMQALAQHGVTEEGVDLYFNQKANTDGKAILGLETADFQIEMITSMGEGNESAFILFSMQDLDQLNEFFDQIVASWKSGDLSQLEAMFVEDLKEFPKIYQDMIVDRNNAWIPQLEKMFATPEIEFVLVGAAHAVGADGVLAQLEKKGYSVEQIEAK